MAIPGADHGANWLTATEAAGRIAAGSLTSRELVQACLDRWQARDASVRAWTFLDPDHALAQADAADDAPLVRRGPLHGVPVGIKDIIYTQDMPTSFNSPHFQDYFPNIDAASVDLLRQAGAIILGKADTVEFAVNGRRAATTNPHDTSRTPGGSSSGSAAAVADGQVPLTLGTQTGGSVIRPAAFCGVWAIKPTWNAVSHEGFKVCAASIDTLGWYGRSAADLDLLAEVFGLSDDTMPQFQSLEGVRFVICRSPVWHQAQKATRDAMDIAVAKLRAAGAIVTELDLPPAFDLLTEAHKVLMQSEMRVSFLPEQRRIGEALYPELVDTLANHAGHSHADLLTAQNIAANCRAQFDELAAPFDAVLTPSTADVAPIGPENTGAAIFNRIWTLLHVPCVNVPGLNGPGGLPIGLTVTGPRFHDRKVIAAAELLGQILTPDQ